MKIVIVGCTHAGVSAVKAIKTFHPEAEVVIYERDDNVSFLSCGISLYLSGEVEKLSDMFYETPEHLASLGVDVKIRHDVLAIDSKAQTLRVQDLKSNAVFDDHYDKLIMSTGSYVQVPPLFGIDDSRVLMCKDARQAELVKKETAAGQHIAIVGAGYIGVELAEAFANTGHKVTLIQGNAQLLNNYIDPCMSASIAKKLVSHGVDVRLNARVKAFEAGSGDVGITVETAAGNVEADVAIVCTGFLANTALLQGQVAMDRHGALLTNQWMQTSDENIYAAGDACAVHFNPTGKSAYVPLASNAVRQGYIVGRNVFGNIQKDLGTQATTAMHLFDHTLATTGLTLVRAKKEGIPADCVTYVGPYRPPFMPDHDDVRITLVYGTEDRRVLGAQLWSTHEITQSANAVSIAIQNRNTIDDLAFVDMLFNPHYDQPFNYLNLVAQLAVTQADHASTSD
ncbi:FAD-dependent oxidoreductase [Lacticaseibacillus porcinae]|uniref:FAD-dependent oxidoreductase n=1 Tax=Lacticaseibacillus porcinae TaxID=1123687 RepID=UPI000F7684D3|nr:FAD-dependent oxidoreductase [Lacticaseibacillus porcinae]